MVSLLLQHEVSFYFPSGHQAFSIREHHSDNRDESTCSLLIRYVFDQIDQFPVICFVVSVFSCKACRVNSRRAVKAVHLKPRVISNSDLPAKLHDLICLLIRILFKCISILYDFNIRHARFIARNDIHAEFFCDGFDFYDFMFILCRCDNRMLHFIFSRTMCIVGVNYTMDFLDFP